MFLPPDFDYHLSPAEQKQVEKLVPMHQAKIHMAFRAQVMVNARELPNSAVALSEHMITLCVPGFLMKSYKLFDTYHLFEIQSIHTVNDDMVRFDFDDDLVVYITTPTCMRFVRNTIRNFILANPSLPAALRFKFKSHDLSFFPPFQPPLSPSQIFQFTYNAYCSYYEVSYYHEIPMYFHQLLNTGNSVFDLTRLPFNVIESNMGDGAEIRPVTSALMYCPYIFGFACANFSRPDIVKNIAALVEVSGLRMVRLVDCGAESGCLDLAEAMRDAQNPSVLYWDLSDNKLEDIGAFVVGLGYYRAEVRAIHLNNCNLKDGDITELFNSLHKNPNLHKLRQLSLIGHPLNINHCQQLNDWLSDDLLDEKHYPALRALSITGVADIDSILTTLSHIGAQLTRLTITNTKFTDASAQKYIELIKVQKRLKSITFDGCTIPIESFMQIVVTLGTLDRIKTLELSFARMNLSGPNFAILMGNIFATMQTKLTSLNLDGNNLTADDMYILTSHINDMMLLDTISLSYNFTDKTPNIANHLCSIASNPRIRTITLRGDETHKLKDQLTQFLSKLGQSKTIDSLDISFNDIRDAGLNALANLIDESKTLRQVFADGSNPSSFDFIEKYLVRLEADEELISAPLPLEDIFESISRRGSAERKRLLAAVTRHQKKLDEVLQVNRAKIGMHSDLSLLKDDELNDILDASTCAVQSLLNGVHLTQHLAITEIVGLPLPFETPTQATNGKTPAAAMTKEDQEYVDPMMMSHINEGVDQSLDMLKTLQFNSLLIRRPNPNRKFVKGALNMRGEDDDDYDDSYDDEEDTRDGPKLNITPSMFAAPDVPEGEHTAAPTAVPTEMPVFAPPT